MKSSSKADLPVENAPMRRAAARRTVLGLTVLYTLSFLLSPARLDNLPITCAWKLLTGIPCPFCGLSHSVAALSHGAPGLAFRLNPFGPVLYAAGLVLLPLSAYIWITGREPLPSYYRRLRVVTILLAAAWGLWWLTVSLPRLF